MGRQRRKQAAGGRRKTPRSDEAAPNESVRGETATDRIDRELAKAALEKQLRGEVPTERERRALRAVERQQEEEKRWKHYRTIPKGHWCKLAGRQVKVVNEQAARYKLPLGGAIIDLALLAPALHDFLAAHARILARAKRDAIIAAGDGRNGDELALMFGESTPALEKLREVKYQREKLLLERELGEWLPAHLVIEAWTTLAQALRRSGEGLQRKFGPEAHIIYDEAISTALDASERKLGGMEKAQQHRRKSVEGTSDVGRNGNGKEGAKDDR